MSPLWKVRRLHQNSVRNIQCSWRSKTNRRDIPHANRALLDRFCNRMLNVLQAVFRPFVCFSRQDDAGKRPTTARDNASFDIRATNIDADEELLNALVPILRRDCSGHEISFRSRN